MIKNELLKMRIYPCLGIESIRIGAHINSLPPLLNRIEKEDKIFKIMNSWMSIELYNSIDIIIDISSCFITEIYFYNQFVGSYNDILKIGALGADILRLTGIWSFDDNALILSTNKPEIELLLCEMNTENTIQNFEDTYNLQVNRIICRNDYLKNNGSNFSIPLNSSEKLNPNAAKLIIQ